MNIMQFNIYIYHDMQYRLWSELGHSIVYNLYFLHIKYIIS
jgi:hypothetical protein